MRRLTITLQLLMLTAFAVRTPELCAQPGRVIVVEHADSLVGRVIDGEQARELIGNVRFSQERVRVACDRALQFVDRGLVELRGNVVVRDDSITLEAPFGLYHRDGRVAEAFDGVVLYDGTLRVTSLSGRYEVDPKVAAFRTDVVVRDTGSILVADSVTYFRSNRRSVATGAVAIYSTADNMTITGERFENFVTPSFSRMTGTPLLVQFDTTAGERIDTLVVRSRVMESYRDSLRRLVAIDSVEIVRTSLSAVAERAVFFTAADSITLRGSPVVWYRGSQISGDSINVELEQRRLRSVLVLGKAVAISESTPPIPGKFDQMSGGTMRLLFADRELEQITVDVRAVSVYHLFDDSTANGLNRTTGDRLVMGFRGGKLDAITVIGGVEGVYVPENLLAGREREYDIQGFNWRSDRPRVRAQDFRGRPVPR